MLRAVLAEADLPASGDALKGDFTDSAAGVPYTTGPFFDPVFHIIAAVSLSGRRPTHIVIFA
jgi:hypothetical protein